MPGIAELALGRGAAGGRRPARGSSPGNIKGPGLQGPDRQGPGHLLQRIPDDQPELRARLKLSIDRAHR